MIAVETAARLAPEGAPQEYWLYLRVRTDEAARRRKRSGREGD